MSLIRWQEVFGKHYEPLANLDILKMFGRKRDYLYRIESDQEMSDMEAAVILCSISTHAVNGFNP